MSCMWVSVNDCSQSHLYHLAQMIMEDEELQIVLAYGLPHTDGSDRNAPAKRAERLLSDLGMPSHLKGFAYLKTAFELCMEDPEEMDGITKRLYPDIAKEHKTSPEKVEHAIRHAIEAAWRRGDERKLRKIFGYGNTEGSRPTNSEFISRLTKHLRNESGNYFS